ncbi:uncharacterized protein BDW47DRAFT_132080 [Aspergillus candidus]|uniref:DUF7905 domain-containing protein n=1 Tax=Aspergillus candidus TaxID=41067 RepID=A0A2I2FA14_ASPCN|nr:hypothetical protein BDW47DRAFT_132080 [Aspergillus candidus]PLB37459.1 hypothetical protein BDW47DRAFT_132080 [Aspergillus candidus]
MSSEWQLVGYGRESLKPHASKATPAKPTKPIQPVQTQPTDPAQPVQRPEPVCKDQATASKTQPETLKRPQKQQKAQVPYSQALKRPAPHIATQPRGSYQSARGRGSSNAKRGQGTPAQQSSRLFSDSPAKSKWRVGTPPTASVRLSIPWGSFKHEFFAAARSSVMGSDSSATQCRYEVFEVINRKTGAYVKPPHFSDPLIHIWGELSQAASAQDILQQVLNKCKSISTTLKKKSEWARIHGHSETKEARFELQERHGAILQQLRRPPESLAMYPEQLLFLWPRDGPSLRDSLGPQLEALDTIRAKFACHLYIPNGLADFICVVGCDHDTIKEIVRRLRTKWSEIIASISVKAKVYVVEPPPSGTVSKILTEKPRNAPFVEFALVRDKIEGTALQQWLARAAMIRSKNDTRLLNAIERSLRGVAFVRGHLRMRVNLGSFVLYEYRRPVNGKSYDFEEFREMLLHEQTKGRLIPGLKTKQDNLLQRCYEATDLLAPYERTSSSLKDHELLYSVNFEFQGSNTAMLRLEAEFAKSPGAHEYEVTQRRWLRPRGSGSVTENRPPLQIGVVDLERSDWQIEIKSLEFYEASAIDSKLRAFSHSVRFQRSSDTGDICAAPRRKVIFPDSDPVSRFVEKTAIRYRLKGTNYIFEIARYDEYSRPRGAALFGTASVSWGASVFDPNWDNLLGEHANLPVGHSARYSPDLHTFFPSRKPSSEPNYPGVWEFIGLVRLVAELLGPVRALTEHAMHPAPASRGANIKKEPIPSNDAVAVGDRGGMLDADLGTLF